MQQTQITAYLAPKGFVNQAAAELKGVQAVHGRLVIASGPPQTSYWAQNTWLEPRTLRIRSITDGAKALPCHPAQLDHVFVSLASSLHVNSGETSVRFGTAIAIPGTCPSKPAGILDLVGARPRSRASTMFKRLSSRRGAVCRKQAGAAVPGVTFRKGNAFSILPDQDSRLDWIFCDMACYPEKLLEWVSIWLNSGKCRNFVCTVKFQGNSHYGVIKKFAAFPHTAFLHLSHNKHELTWISLNVSSHN